MSEPNPFLKKHIAEQWVGTLRGEHAQTEVMDRVKIIYPYVRDWIKENNISGVILDIGSGEGFLSTQIPNDLQYVGIEPSEYLVGVANRDYPSNARKFLVGSAYATGLENENADAVVSVMVWFHLENLQKAAQELYRNLRSGGKFLIISSNPDARKIWESFYENLVVDGKKLSGKVNTPVVPMEESITYIHTNEEVRESLENVGLVVDEILPIGSPEKDDEKIFVAILGCKP